MKVFLTVDSISITYGECNANYVEDLTDGVLDSKIHSASSETSNEFSFTVTDDNSIFLQCSVDGVYGKIIPLILDKKNTRYYYDILTVIEDIPLSNLTLLDGLEDPNIVNEDGILLITSEELNEDSSQITISAWVKPDFDDASYQMAIISKENSFVLSVNNLVNPQHAAQFSIFNGLNWQTISGHTNLESDTWTHLVAIIDGNKISLYQDGSLESSLELSNSIIFSNNEIISFNDVSVTDSQIIIGAETNTKGNKLIHEFSGDIENVAIFNEVLNYYDLKNLYSEEFFEVTSEDILRIDSYSLSHDKTKINNPVTWTLKTSFDQIYTKSAFDLPDDAEVISVKTGILLDPILNLDKKYPNSDLSLSTNWKLLDSSTTKYIINQVKNIDNISTVNIDGDTVSYAALDLESDFIQQDGLRKLLIISDDANIFEIVFTTESPTTTESEFSTEQQYNKKIKVSHDSSLHYTSILTCTNLPEEFIEDDLYFSLFWIESGQETDVTDDPLYSVHYVDADGDGIDEQMCWTVPQLSEQNFVISADISIINLQSYPIVGDLWNVQFTTSGIADLIIRGIDGTEIGDIFPSDLKFIELFNGTHVLDPIVDSNSILYPNYSGDSEAQFSSQVLSSGVHHLEFTFGNDIDVASNSASPDLTSGGIHTISKTCNNPTILATLSTGFEEGPNVVIASTQFTRETNKASTVDVWIEDSSGETIAANTMKLLLHKNHHQNGYTLLTQHNGTANETYSVFACGTATGILGNAKITAFNDMERIKYLDGEPTTVLSGSVETLASFETLFPAGDNVLMVSLQVDNGNIAQEIPPGAIKIINRFGETIASNQYRLNLGSSNPTDIQSIFLVTTDYFAPPEPSYKVTFDSASSELTAEVKILAIQPAGISFEDGDRLAFDSSGNAVLASITTDYSVGDDVIVISAGQFDDEDNGIENIDIGDYRLVENSIPVSLNDFALGSQGGASEGSNFAHTLLYRSNIDSDNPTFTVNATLSRSDGVVGESKLVSFIPKDAGAPPGPTITSIEAGGTGLGFTDGDTITITFSGATNSPAAAEKSDIDTLFSFLKNNVSVSMGKNYVGSWSSPTTLVLTFVDTFGNDSPFIGSLQIQINEESLIKSDDSLSLPSVGTSSILMGDFGTPSGPSITSIVASDPNLLSPTSGFSNEDQITLRFSEDTNNDAGTGWTQTQIDSAFSFFVGQNTVASIGADYSGVWEKPRTFVITIHDVTGGDPVLGGLKIQTIPSGLAIFNSAENSKASDSTSSALKGTWGAGIGPVITSFVADDPDGGDGVYGIGDTLTITFDELTNTFDFDISSAFSFVDIEDNLLTLNLSYEWIDPLTLKFTVDGVTDIPQIDSLQAQIIGGNIKNAAENSLPSESSSPQLTGTFGNKPGPSIVSVSASGEVPGITFDDTLTVKFSEPTNRPLSGTTQDVKNLLRISDVASNSDFSLGSDFSGKWISPSILEIFVIDPVGNDCDVLPGICDVDGNIKVEVLAGGNLKNEQGVSLPSESISNPVSGSFGIKEGPSIVSLTADDPTADPIAGFSIGDTIQIRFSEPTNGVGTNLDKSAVDNLFLFSQSLSDNYSGEWRNSQTFLITIIDDTIDSVPVIGELRATAKSSGGITTVDNLSNPSKSTSPPLSGTFGKQDGPTILSVFANDPGNPDSGVTVDDFLIVTFSKPTNMAPTNLENVEFSNVDTLIGLSDGDSLGDVIGIWDDPITLRIIITNPLGNTLLDGTEIDSTFRLQINPSANLSTFGSIENGELLTKPSDSQSSAIQGTFGSKPGPQITSLKIGDPSNTSLYGPGDEFTILFSESTNQPPVLTKSNIDSLLKFKEYAGGPDVNLGTTLSGFWITPITLKISVVNSAGNSMPDEHSAIGSVVAEIQSGGHLTDAAGSSFDSDTVSPVLQGTFGLSPGPTIKSLVANDPDSLVTHNSVYSVDDTITMRFSESTNKPGDINSDGTLSRQELDKLFSFTQSIGDNYEGKWLDAINLEITITEETLDEPPVIGELRIVAKASAEIKTKNELSESSTSTSPALSGSFGTFEEVIPLADGGTATTTLPSGITTSLSLDDSSSGTLTMENTVLDTTSEETAVFGVLGDTIEITPEGESPCTVESPCVIEFTYDILDVLAIDPEMSPFDVRIIHDLDDNGLIESPNTNGENEVLETVIIQLDENTFRASSSVEHFSKFAVGGVKALALGALASSLSSSEPSVPGSSNDPSSPQIGKTQMNSLGNPSNGFAGILGQVELSSVGEKLILGTDEDLVLTIELYEDQGIANIYHSEVLFDFGGLVMDEHNLTSIIYEKDSLTTINDPNELLSDASLQILEKDTYNGVLQLKVKFQKPMDTSSIQIITWDLEKNTSIKTFENILRIETPQETNKEIPNWVKSSASWWSNGQISDDDFVQGLEFLVKEDIISVKEVTSTESSSEIPSWIKNNAQWWSDGSLPDDEFLSGIEHLIEMGIISVEK